MDSILRLIKDVLGLSRRPRNAEVRNKGFASYAGARVAGALCGRGALGGEPRCRKGPCIEGEHTILADGKETTDAARDDTADES